MIQIDIPMPGDCYECPCHDGESGVCQLTGKYYLDIGIPLSCPLKKVEDVIPIKSKYEYHYDHTDCIWYRPEARNRCPSTCAQYRDGWNDAMNYIFRDGKGYRPYRRDQEYGE